MLFRSLAVIDADQQDTFMTFEPLYVAPLMDTFESVFCGMVILEFKNDGKVIFIQRVKKEINEPFSRLCFPIDPVMVKRIEVTYGHHACEAVLVIILKKWYFFIV